MWNGSPDEWKDQDEKTDVQWRYIGGITCFQEGQKRQNALDCKINNEKLCFGNKS